MKVLLVLLVVLLILLQYKLWVGDGGVLEVRALQGAIEDQRRENWALQKRNRALEADVQDLKTGLDAIEERARLDLGMIRRSETFFRVVEPQPADASAGQ